MYLFILRSDFFLKTIFLFCSPNSILLDEEGHIKITGQCIQQFSAFSVHLLLHFSPSADLVPPLLCLAVSLFQTLD